MRAAAGPRPPLDTTCSRSASSAGAVSGSGSAPGGRSSAITTIRGGGPAAEATASTQRCRLVRPTVGTTTA
ncbi:MAG: hypothetical protein AUG49_17445 [Catenulispora sp. 13_1_20CM_3_70_7]|nr:MAG: hypothetical protein AUG49_17445 [Catenulispora sp. 13_1_20CM_3_70_7]